MNNTTDSTNIRDLNELRELLIESMATATLARASLANSKFGPRDLLKMSANTTFWCGLSGLVAMVIAYVAEMTGISTICIVTISACLVAIGVAQIIRLRKRQLKIETSELGGLNAKIARLEECLSKVDKDLDIPHERTRHEVRVAISQKEIEASFS